MPSFDPTALELRFWEALGLIVLACLFVPLSRRLGLGTIIGYLVAGLAAGAFLSLSFAAHPEELLHFAEFGVVLFLFVIGLEFRPARLWELRGTIFGRGLVQVIACGGVLAFVPLLFGLSWQASLIIGLGLTLSSTALVVQVLDEKGERGSDYGQATFSILLFEDLAIVPLLLLVQLLSPTGEEMSLADNFIAIGFAILAIGLLIGIGRYALEPMFRILARTRMPEIMTASALGVVIAAALIMDLAGMSYAMGAFIAGVMLAESPYRHEVEANIEPFRGLFLGLFFMAVGLSLDLPSVVDNWALILVAVPLFMTLKGLTIYLVSRLFRSSHETSTRTALALAQHGEFGFVLFSAAASATLFDAETASILVAIVTLSMAVSSLLDRLDSLLFKASKPQSIEEDFADAGGSVLIVGFGRFGQIVAQPLLSEHQSITVIDNDADRVREAGRFGSRVHFGDGTRRDVLRAAGAMEARLVILCVNDPQVCDRIVALVQRDFDHLRILARAYDRIHAIKLIDMGVNGVVRETAEAALRVGKEALTSLGYCDADAEDIVARTRSRDQTLLDSQVVAAHGAKDRQTALERILPEPLTKARR
ncbi:monovalent cation:H+ antiporter-2, CPA2 family [Modicisalibacter ilicicola DSM 19980]|uniref:Monovalent cation:H+ antiporter-2, CPA2 family n=1 Tax=Modicisalibacter ilicicola DSM 19980 TaxID=1121942 RepID=A0A1M4ZRU5_9GAMM|nr:monovalent cation:proton antiporter-2 (CPA2) family protein [Halomonas ilicicola]SHF20502.1 monovalent cation:H+ antiporter-2, CPA2 family [Halomonas ilicicola DSM 19980]